MDKTVLWRGAALTDINAIAEYLAEESPEEAEKFSQNAIDTGESLANLSFRGKSVSNLTGYRQILFHRRTYWMIYRVDGDTVKIAAIIHTRQDFMRAWKSKNRFL